jgi:hypothetical protein
VAKDAIISVISANGVRDSGRFVMRANVLAHLTPVLSTYCSIRT